MADDDETNILLNTVFNKFSPVNFFFDKKSSIIINIWYNGYNYQKIKQKPETGNDGKTRKGEERSET